MTVFQLSNMIYLILATLLDVTLFIIGLSFSLIDVEQYSFGLYLVLVAIVFFVGICSLWCAKPKALMKNPAFVEKFLRRLNSANSNYYAERQELININCRDVVKNIRGIPFLIQAIQYSMETTYFTGYSKPTILTEVDVEQSEYSMSGSEKQDCWTMTDKEWINPQLRLDMGQQRSYLTVFPLTESTPLDHDNVQKVRRLSKSVERLPPPERKRGIASMPDTTVIITDDSNDTNVQTIRKSSSVGNIGRFLAVNSEVRRPSLEIRCAGLGNMVKRSMSDKKERRKFKPPTTTLLQK